MTTHANEVARLRTQLREVNIEFSALVRSNANSEKCMRMDELKVRRLALMALIAKAERDRGERAAAATASMETAAQAA